MKRYLTIGLFGFLIWLIPFVVSVLIFPIHDSNRPLFESIMPVVVTGCTVFFVVRYFKNIATGFLAEAALLGGAWLALSIGIDGLFFLAGPFKMPLADYMMDIGLTYLIIPIVTLGGGFLLRQKAA